MTNNYVFGRSMRERERERERETAWYLAIGYAVLNDRGSIRDLQLWMIGRDR